MIPLNQSQPASPGDGMCIRESVYVPVYQNSFADQFRQMHIIFALDIIAHKIAHNDFIIAPGQISVSEKIHKNRSKVFARQYNDNDNFNAIISHLLCY